MSVRADARLNPLADHGAGATADHAGQTNLGGIGADKFPITKDTALDIALSGERQADVLYYNYFRPNPLAPGIVELTPNGTNPIGQRIGGGNRPGQLRRQYRPFGDQDQKLTALRILDFEDELVGSNENLASTGDQMQQKTVNRLPRFGYDGRLAIRDIPLGSKDEGGCIQIRSDTFEDKFQTKPIRHRRTGICRDGFYKLVTLSSDSAGNLTYPKMTLVERDSVAPAKADLQVFKSGPDQFEEYLGLKISEGESYAQAHITTVDPSSSQTRRVVDLDDAGNYRADNLIGRLLCGHNKYSVYVTLVDRAGNASEVAGGEVMSGECPRCASNGIGRFINPIQSPGRGVYGSPFGSARGNGFHAGVDISANTGDPILAAADGKVAKNGVETDDYGNQKGWANYVILDHGGGLYTIYGHMREQSDVSVGTAIKQGQVIGFAGSTGWSEGPHLHFQVQQIGAPLPDGMSQFTASGYGSPVDPAGYLPAQSTNLSSDLLAKYCAQPGLGSGGSGEGTSDDGQAYSQPFPGVRKQDAINSIRNYLDSQLDQEYSQVEAWQNYRQEYFSLSEINMQKSGDKNAFLENSIFPICEGRVWVLLLGRYQKSPQARENPNSRGYDGILVANGFGDASNPRTLLVANGLYSKYAGDGENLNWSNVNACTRIGVPNQEEKNAANPRDSGATAAFPAFYQTFDFGVLDQNQSQTKPSPKFGHNALYGFWDYGFKFTLRYAVFKPGQVHWDRGGTGGVYGFAQEDTQNGQEKQLCRQHFHRGEINFCDPITEYRFVSGGYVWDNKTFRKYRLKLASRDPDADRWRYDGQREVWVLMHGWSNSDQTWSTGGVNLASLLYEEDKNRIVLSLDWSDAAAGGCSYTPMDCPQPDRQASWIDPISDDISDLLRRWGLRDASKLKIIGHSLGTLMGARLSEKMGGAHYLLALSPPGRFNDSFYNTGINGELNSFQGKAKFTRALVQSSTIADNPSLAATADEAWYVNSLDIWNPVDKHGSTPGTVQDLFKSGDLLKSADLSGNHWPRIDTLVDTKNRNFNTLLAVSGPKDQTKAEYLITTKNGQENDNVYILRGTKSDNQRIAPYSSRKLFEMYGGAGSDWFDLRERFTYNVIKDFDGTQDNNERIILNKTYANSRVYDYKIADLEGKKVILQNNSNSQYQPLVIIEGKSSTQITEESLSDAKSQDPLKNTKSTIVLK